MLQTEPEEGKDNKKKKCIMPRVATDWISYGRKNYKKFCKENPEIKLTYDEWRNILYTFSDEFKFYILETGEKARLPFGFGDF